MPKFNVRMTEYYEFKNVEAANEEEAKHEITDYVWSDHMKDVIFDVEKEEEND